jgi:hypothetical protein
MKSERSRDAVPMGRTLEHAHYMYKYFEYSNTSDSVVGLM